MMTIKKRALQVLACGICAVVAPSAFAGAQPGFYLGISGGNSSFDLDKEELDDIVLDEFFSAGAPVISATSTFEDSDNSLALFAGYRFLPYLAVEASYLDLGTAEYRSSGTVNPPGPTTSVPASLTMDIETKGFTFAGIGSVPIGEVVDLHGRLGFLVAQTELSVAATINSSIGRESDSIDSASAFFGIGAGFHLGEHWSLSLDWARYVNVGDENEDDDYDTDEGFDINAVSFSASYRF